MFVILCAFAVSGCATKGKNIRGVENFAIVQVGVLLRGAQPTAEGIKELSHRGVKTVINLRADAKPWEKEKVNQAGMDYVFIPTVAERNDPQAIAKFLDAVRTKEKPAFVHCRVGRDRTGLEVAVWRITDCGWTKDDAIKELHEHGYQWAWFPNIERYLRTFDPKSFTPTVTASEP
jgi:uncharacterized protein (TIGR01244 family)